jgi:hypothetical protein
LNVSHFACGVKTVGIHGENSENAEGLVPGWQGNGSDILISGWQALGILMLRVVRAPVSV